MIDLSNWLWPGAGLGLGDEFTRPWWYFSLLLWLLVGGFSLLSQLRDTRALRYWLFFTLCFAGNMLLIAALDAVSFYLGFSLMSLAAYGLVIHNNTAKARRAGRLYLQLAVLGEILLFSGLLLRASAAGGRFDWHSWQAVPLEPLSLTLLLLGLGLKAGFWPLHWWLPQAHPVAPAPASALLSGVMIKAGLLGMLMFLPATDTLMQQWAPLLLVIGLISAFYGVLAGLLYTQAKVILAYSSVSQMGYLLLLFALLSLTGVAALPVLLAYVVHHGMAKASLFLYAGMAGEAAGRIWRQALFWLAALALMALPLSSGALVKTGLKTQLAAANLPAWLDVGLLSQLLTAGAVLTALVLLHLAAQLRAAINKQSNHTAKASANTKASAGNSTGRWALLTLLVSALWVLPWFIVQYWQLAWPTLPLYAGLVWPLLLALLLRWLWYKLGWQLPNHWYNRNAPALYYSLRLKRLYQPLNQPQWHWPAFSLRPLERRINRALNRPLVSTTALLCCVLFVLLLGSSTM
ncbi:formate hydrogenlyase subunit 3/multisubunit Na+/H+ antiporter MnhD subunit [Rheinheimera pacifica]|uniref:complex I subunit 5 family protein n=1 Tax=Rheinheimera pacifica TaxID=173990 RepID=UPI002854D6FC|nr:complex I subunit 5 family protein [Rheinheimera pacifica]MDR6982841.1 formate hydrogenlyase subunit 3/multisubunit Na+/H+ antiporter MnhD subunit [Rheinheimera pacifica]